MFSPHEGGVGEEIPRECVYPDEMGFGRKSIRLEEWTVAATNAQLSKLSFQDLEGARKGRVSPRVVQARWRGTRALSRSGRTSGNAIPVATRGQPHEVLMSAGLNQPRPTPPVVSPSSRHRLLASGRWKKFSRLFCIPRAPIFSPPSFPFLPSSSPPLSSRSCGGYNSTRGRGEGLVVA